MADWLLHRPVMLDELLHADGLGDSQTLGPCVKCKKLVGEYRCCDCLWGGMCCSGCIVSSHNHHPLHRLQVCPKLCHSGHATEILGLGLVKWVFRARNA